jgi:hypothetical protein
MSCSGIRSNSTAVARCHSACDSVTSRTPRVAAAISRSHGSAGCAMVCWMVLLARVREISETQAIPASVACRKTRRAWGRSW